MKLLLPSILSADFAHLQRDVNASVLGGADSIHCDIMDGHFVPNISFGSMVVKAARRITDIPLDVHLMIENPELYLEEFAKAGASCISIHQEACLHLDRTIHRIKELGCMAGVSINPSTPVSFLSEVLDIADLILVMSVNPGFGGQSLIPGCLNKIEALSDLKKRQGYKYIIEIDGGINIDNISAVSNAGCEAFVAGSAVFSQDNITEATRALKQKIEQ